jgi:hypothetical protein
MVVFGGSETSETLMNCYPRDLRSHAITLVILVSINCDSYVIFMVVLSKVLKSASEL